MKFFRIFLLIVLAGFFPAPAQAVAADTTVPAISWEIVQPGILGVTADDAESMPARLEVSLDGGQTWQSLDFPASWVTPQIQTPSVTWNIELLPGLNHVEIRAFDGAGNVSQASAEIEND